MAIMKTDSANYSAIADAIRAKGVEGTFKPNQMADAIASITGGGSIVSGNLYTMIADTEHYGNTTFYAGSNVSATMALPSGVSFDDVVFIAGVGAMNSSASARTSGRIMPYVYCPMIYDATMTGSALVDGGTIHMCAGFVEGFYSTTYEIGVLAGGPNNVGSWYSTAHFIGCGPYGSNVRFIAVNEDNNAEAAIYPLAKYGRAVMIYRK